MDTTKADLPIDIVNFVGKSHWGSLPKGSWSTMKDQKRYMIVSFGFNSKVDPVKYNPYNLTLVSIFRDGQSRYFTKEDIDSVMESHVPLDNGNN